MSVPKIQLDYIQKLEDLRQENYDRLHDSALIWSGLANDRSSEISKRLFTIASLIIPLSLFPLTNSEVLKIINLESSYYIVTSWIFFILSLAIGMIHLSIESDFFYKWAQQENDRSSKYTESILTTSAIKAFNRFNKMNEDSIKLALMESKPQMIFLYLQAAMMIVGIVLLGLAIKSILF